MSTILLVNVSNGTVQLELNTPPPLARARMRSKRNLPIMIPRGSKIDVCQRLGVDLETARSICATSPQLKMFGSRIKMIDTSVEAAPPSPAPEPEAPVTSPEPPDPTPPVEPEAPTEPEGDKEKAPEDTSEDTPIEETDTSDPEPTPEELPTSKEPVKPELLIDLPEGEPSAEWEKKELLKYARAYGISVGNFDSKKKLLDKIANWKNG